jgi:hypothetical protein
MLLECNALIGCGGTHPITQEAKAGESWVEDQPGLPGESLFQKKKKVIFCMEVEGVEEKVGVCFALLFPM